MYDSYTFRTNPSADPATTDAFLDVPLTEVLDGALQEILIAPSSGPLSLNWKNTGANSIDSKVLGSNDRTLAAADWAEVAAPAAIAAGASRHIALDIAHYHFYRLQHKATGAGSQGASSVRGCLKRI